MSPGPELCKGSQGTNCGREGGRAWGARADQEQPRGTGSFPETLFCPHCCPPKPQGLEEDFLAVALARNTRGQATDVSGHFKSQAPLRQAERWHLPGHSLHATRGVPPTSVLLCGRLERGKTPRATPKSLPLIGSEALHGPCASAVVL